MASVHSSATLNSLWKEVYADNLENLIPDNSKLMKKYKFKSGKKLGEYFVQPVIVSRSHGFTRGRGNQTLNDAIVHETAQAQLNPFPIYLRESVPYDVAARMVESKASFAMHTKQVVQQMMESMYFRAELELLYGQSGIGVAASSANIGATSTTTTISAASFAPGIWAGAENAKVKFHLVSNGNLVSSGADAIFTVSTIDTDARTVVIVGTSTGITALDSALAAPCNISWADSSASAFCDVENPGLQKILTNTGTLFNINAATYNLWKGNSFAVGGVDLTMKRALSGIAKAVGRGLNEDVDCFVSTKTFENLNSDQAALRRYNMKTEKAENGSEAICYYGSNGKVEVQAHNLVKEGDAFAVPSKRVIRTGSTDITFKLPGRDESDIFLHSPTQTHYELRCMAEQGIMLLTPARAVYYSGIVNS